MTVAPNRKQAVAQAIAQSLVASGVFPGKRDTDPWVIGPSCVAAQAALKAAGFECWRRISSAPKDRPILLWTGQKIVMARWIAGDPQCVEGISQARRQLISQHGGYWSAHFRGTKPLVGFPSHWHPLPELPEVSAQ